MRGRAPHARPTRSGRNGGGAISTLVVVTGGSSGLGRAVLAAAPPGAHRVDVSRRGPDDPAVAHLATDLADPTGWSDAGDAIDREIGHGRWERITLVHAAGTLDPIGYAGEVDTAAYARNVVLNSAAGQVLGHRFLAAVRHLDTRRELVMVSTGRGTVSPGWSAYKAGKGALDEWVRNVGAEQADRGGVRVLAVAPGVIATAMQDMIRETGERDFPRVERFRRLHAEGALADPADVADRLWTLLDDPGVTTGTVLDLPAHA